MKSCHRLATRVVLYSALIVTLFHVVGNAQVIDSDENFEAVHHDIGRITSASSATVADATIIRNNQPQPHSQLQAAVLPSIEKPASAVEEQPPAARPLRRKVARRVNYVVKPFADDAVIRANNVNTNQENSNRARQIQSNSQPQRIVAASIVASPAPLLLPSQPPPPQQPPVVAPHSHAAFNDQSAASQSQAIVALPQPIALPSHTPQFASSIHVAPQAANTPVASIDEPIPEPSFESVAASGCPSLGVFSWPNKNFCDRYFMCTNGTFTEEACPNGLAYSKLGAVYQHCAYNWNVDCGVRKSPPPAPSAGCDWQFGIFAHAPNQCSINYHVCEWGLPDVRQCKDGLFYDDRIKGCQWADQLGCKSEPIIQFKCPLNDEDNQYYPFPRYYHTQNDIIVCVNDTPRLVHCNEDQFADPQSLACLDKNPKKKKAQFLSSATRLQPTFVTRN